MPAERTPLEQRIAAALQARAADVTPDPATWREVEARIARDRRFRFGAVGFAIAAVAAFAVIAVPTLVRRATDVELQPGPAALSTAPATLSPPATPTAPVPAAPAPSAEGDGAETAQRSSRLVMTDGTTLTLGDLTGAVIRPLANADAGSAIASVAVWPGSTEDDLVFAYGLETQGCGSAPQWGRSIDSGAATPEPVTAQLPQDWCAGRPVFSPDGEWLAWIERVPFGAPASGEPETISLHAVRWGTNGPVPSSDVTFGVFGDQEFPPFIVDLVHWTWDEINGDTRRGAIKILSVDPDGGGSVWTVPTEVQADGALALTGEPMPLGTHNGALVVARTDPADIRVRWVDGGFVESVELVRREVPESAPLPLTVGHVGPWLTAADDFVLVGSTSGEAYLVRWNAEAAAWDEPQRLAGTVRFAAPLPAG